MSDIDVIEEVMSQCDYPEEDWEEELSEEYLEEMRRYEAMTDEEKDIFWEEKRKEQLKFWKENWNE